MVAVRRHLPEEPLDQRLVPGLEAQARARRLPEDHVGAVGVQDRPAAVGQVGGAGGRADARRGRRSERRGPAADPVTAGATRSAPAAAARSPPGRSRAVTARRRHHLAASQSGPMPASTASGGSISNAPAISRRPAISRLARASSAGPSNSSSSWIWRISCELSPACCSGVVAADHGDLHDVGRGALDDHVDREPLALLAQLPAPRAQLGHLAAAPEQRRDVAVLGALLDRLLDEPRHGREPGQVALDELVRFLLGDVQPVGHPPGREPVNDSVVDHLRLRTHSRVDLIRCHPKHTTGRSGVDIFAFSEDFLEHVLAGDVGQQPQLDLRVVGRDQQVPRLGDEAGADLPPERGPDRDVLEVGVVGGQPAGGGRGLVERGVDPPVAGDQLRAARRGRSGPAWSAPASARSSGSPGARGGSPGARGRRSSSRSCRGACARGRACRTGPPRAAGASRA